MAENNRSTFDFSDQYGSDPIVRRYRPTNYMDIRESEAATRSVAAQRELSEANLAKAQAELSAQLAPMKAASDAIASMSSLIKTRTALQDEAAIRRDSAAISESIGQAGDLKSLTAIGQSNRMGLKDEGTKMLYTDRTVGLFTSATINAQNPFEVDRVFSEMDPMVAALPEVQTAYNNIRTQAERRFNVSTTYAASPSLGTVPTTPSGEIEVAAGMTGVAVQEAAEARRENARKDLQFVQKQIEALERKVSLDTDTLGAPVQSDTLELDQLRADASILLREVLQRDRKSTEAPTAAAVPPEPSAAADAVGALLPSGAAAPLPAATQAAVASSAATGGETPVTTAAPAPAPATLEQEAQQAAETAAPERIAPGAGRAAKAAEAKRKRDEANRIKLLKDERTKLQSAIYQKQGRGGGGRITTRLKPGLDEDNDVVQRTRARIDEITAELGK